MLCAAHKVFNSHMLYLAQRAILNPQSYLGKCMWKFHAMKNFYASFYIQYILARPCSICKKSKLFHSAFKKIQFTSDMDFVHNYIM